MLMVSAQVDAALVRKERTQTMEVMLWATGAVHPSGSSSLLVVSRAGNGGGYRVPHSSP